MAEPWERTVSCKDALGRSRQFRVYLVHDSGEIRVGFHTPAGEAAELALSAMAELHDILAAARLEATRRGATWR